MTAEPRRAQRSPTASCVARACHRPPCGQQERGRRGKCGARMRYPLQTITRNSFGLMTRKLSVTESRKSSHGIEPLTLQFSVAVKPMVANKRRSNSTHKKLYEIPSSELPGRVRLCCPAHCRLECVQSRWTVSPTRAMLSSQARRRRRRLSTLPASERSRGCVGDSGCCREHGRSRWRNSLIHN